MAWLEELAGKLPRATHADAIGWLEARLNLKSLVSEVEQSTGRIEKLVKAVKSYSYMDQSPMQEVDIHEGIESTLTMLGHKLKNVTLVRAFDRSVPRIMAYGSELNQVWTNLIDNAIATVNGTGTGLGLIISNRIVGDRHGGEIEFESRPGETRFKVRLPIHREQPSTPEQGH